MNSDYDIVFFIFIAARMSGCIAFNPILGRKNIPAMTKAALIVAMTVLTYNAVPYQAIVINNNLVLVVELVKELLIGFIIGYVVQLFLSVIIIGGEVMDSQIGISMSKVYDSTSNVSMPVSSSILNAMYLMIFFMSNSHLSLIKIFLNLGQLVPYGQLTFGNNTFKLLIGLFSTILLYSVKLAMPILAVEFIAEIGVGLLMKAVPQINVFIVNLQLKVLLGFVAIMILIPAYATFFDRLTNLMLDKIVTLF